MYAFIDNNIFVNLNYKFDTGDLKELKTYINNNLVQLIITPVSNAELRKHYEKRVTQSILNKYIGLLKAFEEFNIPYLTDLTEDEIKRKLTNPLEQFLATPTNISLDISRLNIEALIDDYHHGRLPFEASKEDEFKDAINVQLLKRYQESKDETIYIISGDKGFNKAFEDNEGNKFKIYKSLNEFNTHLREYEANYKMIGYAIERHFGLPEFCDEVYNYLSNPKAYLYYDDRITLVDILKVNFKTPQYAITELTDNQCHGTIYLTGKCLVKYINSTDIHAFDIDESVSQDLLINGKIRFHTSVPFEIEYHRKEYNDNDVATNWLIDNFIINWSDLQIKLSQNDIHAISIDLEGSINLL